MFTVRAKTFQQADILCARIRALKTKIVPIRAEYKKQHDGQETCLCKYNCRAFVSSVAFVVVSQKEPASIRASQQKYILEGPGTMLCCLRTYRLHGMATTPYTEQQSKSSDHDRGTAANNTQLTVDDAQADNLCPRPFGVRDVFLILAEHLFSI